jgi:Mrp family chromosome partitioning ATPase
MSTDIDIKTDVTDSGPVTWANGTLKNGAELNGTHPLAPAAPAVCQRPGADYFDALLWRLFDRREDADGVGYLLGVTGCARQSGVTTVAANLAIRAADHGLGPVLLVDANDHHPQLHRVFGAKSRSGLADVLAGQAALAAAVLPTRVPGLQLLPLGIAGQLGRVRTDPSRVEGLVAELRETYSLVLVDLPGACQMSHSYWLAHALDGAVLVIRSERIGRNAATESMRRLAHDGIHVLGAVLTDQHTYLPSWLA